ncbi:membrane-bound PQQ-dependent dehydrogenase, glucose/quinate/shikimate family [Paracoccus aurantiacus]|uniref:Membrane-bound PQQ-dependent dehydrogenase, glucose/quinate/shikimate family n=1 Tax=Paracoccus aurantiacus TaxID=2599412 RepID=A0A5C6S6L7_9RHOB|nr:membrane-bound PQQ-dependent dehydrogenase, glucose/quinate/shikimate family [Paracoccus aurantiacus]TXB69274.1 membrane-bound PQQ-dependent dehydrogenase, glucose/quinate/shikimate family [Paracoccus aurantiacus]
MLIPILSLLFLLAGAALAIGGGWLLSLGGSPYYLAAGLGFLATGLLLWRRRAAAYIVYAVTLGGTLAWAIWEVGFDWWQLAPRGGIPVLLGLLLLLPALRRRLDDPAPAGRAVLAAVTLAAIASAGYSMLRDPSAIHGEMTKDIAQPMRENLNTGNEAGDGEWHQYGRTSFGQRWSPLEQITPENVKDLQLAWQYQTGDVKLPDDVGETTYQVTPIKIGDSLYVCTPHNIAISLDARTGKENWRYNADSGMNPNRQHQTCRGVTWWETPQNVSADATPQQAALHAQALAECPRRIYLPTADARLIALNADTGDVCTFFADNGVLHLEAGMKYDPAGYYYSTSPPVATDGKLIIGGAVNDNFSTEEQSGVIRAFDIDSGELIWNWDSAKPTETAPIDIAGGERYTTNSPNSWSVFSYDEALGLVYVPMGNRVPDQLGMGRSPEVEAHSSSIVALDIRTGQQRWVRQTVHHDLWDMDVPAQPVLVDLTRDGNVVPALVAPTKQGDMWVLDRRTGVPLSPREELPAPGGAIPEDFTSPTQPISKLTFRPDRLHEANMWGITMFDQLSCRIKYRSLDYEGQYTPPSLKGTIVFPGNFGTFNWGSVAVDPERQVMFGMPTYLPFTSRLVPAADIPPKGADEKASEQGLNRNDGAPYGVFMGPFLSALGVPCTAPPWGYVSGADLRGENVVYKLKNGTVRDMTPLPLKIKLGVPGIGGPMMTRSGVAFLGAAVDDYVRGYDVTTGEQLWEARLPAGGQSTPMTYTVDDKQYVVIVAGGHGSVGTKPGDYIMAYSLP